MTWVKLSWSSLSSQVTLNQESKQGSPFRHPSFSFQYIPAVVPYRVSRAFGDWRKEKKEQKERKEKEKRERR